MFVEVQGFNWLDDCINIITRLKYQYPNWVQPNQMIIYPADENVYKSILWRSLPNAAMRSSSLPSCSSSSTLSRKSKQGVLLQVTMVICIRLGHVGQKILQDTLYPLTHISDTGVWHEDKTIKWFYCLITPETMVDELISRYCSSTRFHAVPLLVYTQKRYTLMPFLEGY